MSLSNVQRFGRHTAHNQLGSLLSLTHVFDKLRWSEIPRRVQNPQASTSAGRRHQMLQHSHQLSESGARTQQPPPEVQERAAAKHFDKFHSANKPSAEQLHIEPHRQHKPGRLVFPVLHGAQLAQRQRTRRWLPQPIRRLHNLHDFKPIRH